MNPNGMVFLLIMILVGVPLIILVYYGAQLALRLPRSPAQVQEGWRKTAAHIDSSPDAAAPERVNVARPWSAVIRVSPLQECGLPYASRSG